MSESDIKFEVIHLSECTEFCNSEVSSIMENGVDVSENLIESKSDIPERVDTMGFDSDIFYKVA